MSSSIKEYAVALFALARETNNENSFAQGLCVITQAFEQNKDYVLLLSAPSIPQSQRLDALKQAFDTHIDEYLLSFVQLLCKKGKIADFCEIAKEYHALKAAFERISKVKVKSAVELTNEQKNKLEQKLESTYNIKVQAHYEIDTTLLGGLVVELDGKVIDSSLRNRLGKVKDVISV